ncbi:peptidyl-prolyl cis-trans isomerase [Fodinibius salsisoli]|uniref:peptidylprolyl isomerase n=1 Tax=Fodinibius salsisoli TaxID=2820877 RepID=A0ABT3PK30_9BACT|nr:peptidyl-prolyl cis-trans isomerase [Fodinibius salsisoli]MCW9706308.1 peptidyl-prolyl cis-trans isomerase [Fodinibius salsisoli]
MQNILLLFRISAAIFILSLSACRGQYSTDTESQNLARVDSQYLTVEQAKQDIPSSFYQEDSLYALQQYREQWIQEQLLLKEANRLGVEDREAVQKKIKQARTEILQEALRAYIMSSEVDSTITEQEAQNYFNNHKNHFTLQEPYVQFRHLQTQNITDARTAKQALRDSISWKVVAQKYTSNPKKAVQKSQRYLPLSMALADIEIMQTYLGTIDIGAISAIQRVNGMYHFVQLTDRREEGSSPDLDWLMDEIKNLLILEKRQRKFNSYLKNLYLKAESDNEIASYNVLSTQTNPKNSTQDTLESNSTDE